MKRSMNRVVWEGWTPQDFVEELEPCFDMIMTGGSWQKPFHTRKEVEAWTSDNQPYYKKVVPEVVDYFCEKYRIVG